MYTIAHVPGKSLVTADALSRAPQERPLTEAEELLTDEVMAQANLVVGALPATEKRLADIQSPKPTTLLSQHLVLYCFTLFIVLGGEAYVKGALYRIQILCRRYTLWSYPAGFTRADQPG